MLKEDPYFSIYNHCDVKRVCVMWDYKSYGGPAWFLNCWFVKAGNARVRSSFGSVLFWYRDMAPSPHSYHGENIRRDLGIVLWKPTLTKKVFVILGEYYSPCMNSGLRNFIWCHYNAIDLVIYWFFDNDKSDWDYKSEISAMGSFRILYNKIQTLSNMYQQQSGRKCGVGSQRTCGHFFGS